MQVKPGPHLASFAIHKLIRSNVLECDFIGRSLMSSLGEDHFGLQEPNSLQINFSHSMYEFLMQSFKVRF